MKKEGENHNLLTWMSTAKQKEAKDENICYVGVVSLHRYRQYPVEKLLAGEYDERYQSDTDKPSVLFDMHFVIYDQKEVACTQTGIKAGRVGASKSGYILKMSAGKKAVLEGAAQGNFSRYITEAVSVDDVRAYLKGNLAPTAIMKPPLKIVHIK